MSKECPLISPNRLFFIRQARGLSIQKVASLLNIQEQKYENYEKGIIEPSIHRLIAMAAIFEVTTDYLLGFSDSLYAAGKYQNGQLDFIRELLLLRSAVSETLFDRFVTMLNDFCELKSCGEDILLEDFCAKRGFVVPK